VRKISRLTYSMVSHDRLKLTHGEFQVRMSNAAFSPPDLDPDCLKPRVGVE